MDDIWKQVVSRQLGASLEMLANAIEQCPEELWSARDRVPECWHLAYHTLFWLDLYLSGSVEGFAPPAPFTLDERDPDSVPPALPYSRTEILGYLRHCRGKTRAALEGLTPEVAARQCVFPWIRSSFAELLLYNLRHVQHGAAQLNLALRQTTGSAPRWVRHAQLTDAK